MSWKTKTEELFQIKGIFNQRLKGHDSQTQYVLLDQTLYWKMTGMTAQTGIQTEVKVLFQCKFFWI